MAFCPIGCSFFYSFDAVYQNPASARRGNSSIAVSSTGKIPELGYWYRYLSGSFGVYYPVACGFIFQ
jgi:hypothetical protein